MLLQPPAPWLRMVAVHFSTRCGSKCSFCYYGDPLSKKDAPTSWEMIEKILARLAEGGVKEVLFVGGDPVLHPDFAKSISYAKHLHLTTSVLSNSWALTPPGDVSRQLSFIDSCEATILGHNAELHDSIAGTANAYRRLVENLVKLCDRGKSIGVCLNAMPQNIEHLYDSVAVLANTPGIVLRAVMFQRIVPSGHSKGEMRFGLNMTDVDILMQQVAKIDRDFRLPITFEDPVPHCVVQPHYRHYLGRCEWGYTRGSVNHRGELNRCGADDHYRLGNIFDCDVQEIWSTHPILVDFRSKHYLPDECKRCDLLEVCGGGCPLSCGTHQDHDIDLLYLERGVVESGGGNIVAIRPNTIQLTVSGGCVSANLHDLAQICRLERELFPDAAGLFTMGILSRLTSRYPNALRVAKQNGEILGYASVVPITKVGLELSLLGQAYSICDMPDDGIEPDIDKSHALFIEVIAFSLQCPLFMKMALSRWLLDQVRGYKQPLLASPISSDGESLLTRRRFTLLHTAKGRRLFLKYPDVIDSPQV